MAGGSQNLELLSKARRDGAESLGRQPPQLRSVGSPQVLRFYPGLAANFLHTAYTGRWASAQTSRAAARSGSGTQRTDSTVTIEFAATTAGPPWEKRTAGPRLSTWLDSRDDC